MLVSNEMAQQRAYFWIKIWYRYPGQIQIQVGVTSNNVFWNNFGLSLKIGI